jgi:hypothetical protein
MPDIGLIWSMDIFFKESGLNGICSRANCRASSVIFVALDKHNWMFRVCNYVPKYVWELVIRGVDASILNLGTRKRRKVSFKPWTTLHFYTDESKMTKLFLCLYKQHFSKKCWRLGWKAPHILTLRFNECEWLASCYDCFSHKIWRWVGTEPGLYALENKLSLACLDFPTRLPRKNRKWRSRYTDWAILSIKLIVTVSWTE